MNLFSNFNVAILSSICFLGHRICIKVSSVPQFLPPHLMTLQIYDVAVSKDNLLRRIIEVFNPSSLTKFCKPRLKGMELLNMLKFKAA